MSRETTLPGQKNIYINLVDDNGDDICTEEGEKMLGTTDLYETEPEWRPLV